MTAPDVGVCAVGMYAPPEIRRNDWWPAEVVARWQEQRRAASPPPLPADLSEGARRVVAAFAAQAHDPFQGTVERRVLAPAMSILDMEERAARDAIDRAGIDPASIDLLLTHAVVPDHQLANPACPLHHRLGLSAMCLSVHIEATAYTVLAQLAIAEAMIRSGRAQYALLVQSCAGTRLVEMIDPISVVVGDAATAMVIGPVSAGRGLLSFAHYTEGRFPLSLIMSVPGGRWFDEGKVRIHAGDPRQLLEAQLTIPDVCGHSAQIALERAKCDLGDIDFACVCQGTRWSQRVVCEHLGLTDVRRVEVFPSFGYLSSAMIPAALYVAEQNKELAKDDLVLLTGGGTGQTYGSSVLRWGS